MPSKTKVLLAYILAKSVWQYYNSDFMKAPWTTDSVHFMQEDSQDGNHQWEINPAIPCFAFSPLTAEQLEFAEYCGERSVLHRYPRVLALAVLLVEICRKEPKRITEARSIEERINNDFIRCKDIIKSSIWPHLDLRNPEAIQTYKNSVRYCLDPGLFHIPMQTQSSIDAAIKKRRNALYTYVVLPLATLCADLGIIDKRDDIGRLTYSEPNITQPLEPQLLISSSKQM